MTSSVGGDFCIKCWVVGHKMMDDNTSPVISNTSSLVVDGISVFSNSSQIQANFDAVEWNSVGATSPILHHDEMDLQASSWLSFSVVTIDVEGLIVMLDPAVHASIESMLVIRSCGAGDCDVAHLLSYLDGSVEKFLASVTVLVVPVLTIHDWTSSTARHVILSKDFASSVGYFQVAFFFPRGQF